MPPCSYASTSNSESVQLTSALAIGESITVSDNKAAEYAKSSRRPHLNTLLFFSKSSTETRTLAGIVP